jgi:hypothetical protein
MNSKTRRFTAAAALILLALMVAAPIAVSQSDDVLKPGAYTAKVKAIVCGGCGPLIQKTMTGMKEIEAVSVDQANKTVKFAVKKDTTLKVTELQKALKAAADKMGMGADYTLSELKAAK